MPAGPLSMASLKPTEHALPSLAAGALEGPVFSQPPLWAAGDSGVSVHRASLRGLFTMASPSSVACEEKTPWLSPEATGRAAPPPPGDECCGPTTTNSVSGTCSRLCLPTTSPPHFLSAGGWLPLASPHPSLGWGACRERSLGVFLSSSGILP